MKRTKKQQTTIDAVKAARKASREEEIAAHGKLIMYTKIKKSKKKYNRKVLKREPFVILKQNMKLLVLSILMMVMTSCTNVVVWRPTEVLFVGALAILSLFFLFRPRKRK